MKKGILFLISILFFVSCETSPHKQTLREGNDSVDTTKTQHDFLPQLFEKKKLHGTTEVMIKDALPENNSGFYIVFRLQNGKATDPKLHIQYAGQNVFQFSVNGDKYTYKSNFSKGKGENRSEWYEYDLRPEDMRLFYSLDHAKSANIIFSDGTLLPLHQYEVDNINKTLLYFEQLGGKRPSMITLP